MTDLTRERELREEAEKFARDNGWMMAEGETIVDDLVNFALPRIVSLQEDLDAAVAGYDRRAQSHKEIVDELKAELAGTRQAEREQNIKTMCLECKRGHVAKYRRYTNSTKIDIELNPLGWFHDNGTNCYAAAIHERERK